MNGSICSESADSSIKPSNENVEIPAEFTNTPPINPNNISLNETNFLTDPQIDEISSIIVKRNTISVDIENNLFSITDFIPSNKRKGKLKQFKNEIIELDTYAKKTGFLTSRPVLWAQAIEKYLSDTADTSCRWEYVVDNGLYCACKLLFYFEITIKVEILIDIKNGLLIVQGCYKEWANKVFPSLQALMDGENEEKTSEVPKSNNKSKSDIVLLWEENDTLKNCIKCLEKAVESSNSHLTNANDLIRQQAVEFEHRHRRLRQQEGCVNK